MKNIRLIKDTKNCKMITKEIIADKLLAYLQHHWSLSDLVNWAEQSLMNGSYEDDKAHTN